MTRSPSARSRAGAETVPGEVDVRPSPLHGRGVFARNGIAADSRIGEYTGRETDVDGTHVLWVDEGDHWSARDGDPPLKFLNHSKTPNAYFDGYMLFAARDIAAGEEITFDYGDEWPD